MAEHRATLSPSARLDSPRTANVDGWEVSDLAASRISPKLSQGLVIAEVASAMGVYSRRKFLSPSSLAVASVALLGSKSNDVSTGPETVERDSVDTVQIECRFRVGGAGMLFARDGKLAVSKPMQGEVP